MFRRRDDAPAPTVGHGARPGGHPGAHLVAGERGQRHRGRPPRGGAAHPRARAADHAQLGPAHADGSLRTSPLHYDGCTVYLVVSAVATPLYIAPRCGFKS